MRVINFVLCIFILFSFTVSAQTSAKLKFPSETSAKFGQSVFIPIKITTDSLLSSAKIIFAYDSTVLNLKDVLPGSELDVNTTIKFEDYSGNPGNSNHYVQIDIAGDTLNAVNNENLELVLLDFEVIRHHGSSQFTFDQHTVLTVINQNEITAEKLLFVDGLFNINANISAMLSMKTDTLNVLEGTHFKVDLNIADVFELNTFVVSLNFNPNIIRVDSVVIGNFLNNDAQNTVVWSQPAIDNITGTISNISASIENDGEVDGSGDFASIYFQAISPGESAIEYLNDQCQLSTRNNVEIQILKLEQIAVNIYRKPVAHLTVAESFGAPNRTIEIPVSISGIEHTSIISIFMIVTADKNCLIPGGVVTDGTLTESWQQPAINFVDDKMIFAMAGSKPLEKDSVLLKLRYKVNPDAAANGECLVKIENVMLNEGDPTTIITNGTFHVRGFQIIGNVFYHGTEIPVPDVTMNLSGTHSASINTNQSGAYNFSQLHYADYKVKPSKSDGIGTSITPFDAALVLQYVVQLTQLSPYQLLAADVTGDNTVSALDAAHLLQFSVGLIESFPAMQTSKNFWRFVVQDFEITEANRFEAPDSLLYLPLIKDQFNQNFVGIIYGDVSQNWQLPSIVKKQHTVSTKNISLGKIQKVSQHLFLLPVHINDLKDILSMELDIQVNNDQFILDKIEKTKLSEHFILSHHFDCGHLKTSFACSQSNQQEGGTFINIYFKAELIDDSEFEICKAEINEGTISVLTGNVDQSEITQKPDEFKLSQNYPNPFNNQTQITYSIPDNGLVKLNVYNLFGQKVRSLLSQKRDAGTHSAYWAGKDDYGNMVASGEYIIEIQFNDQFRFIKVVLLK